MSSLHTLCEEIEEAVWEHDLTAIEDWVSKGGELFNKSGWTIYYEVAGCGTVDFLEKLLKQYPNSTHLIRRRNKRFSGWTSIHRCCILARYENETGHSLGLLDTFCGAADGGGLTDKDDKGRTCLDLASGNKGLREYIKWRVKHGTGLPPEIRRQNNRSVHQYIHTFGKMDSKSSKRYRKAIKGQTETSYCIRMVFLGHERVGKTTLMFRMTGQDVAEVKPTNQLDVLRNIMIVDLVNHQRQLLQPGMEHELTRQRIKDIIVDSVLAKPTKGAKESIKAVPNAIKNRVRRFSLSGTQSITNVTKSNIDKETAVIMSSGPTETFGQKGMKACVSIFDFGGEMLFSSFQHIFLNQSAVVLMCFSLHDCFQKDAILERVSFWLRFLSTFSDKDDKYLPPVILVGTHLDKVPEKERDLVKGRVLYRINKNRTVAKAYSKHVIAFTTVDSTLDGTEAYDKVWQRVLEAAQYQSHWGQLLPASWITLERDLMLLKGQGVKVMTLKDVKARATQLIVPLDDQDVIAMLEYLHMIRNVLCFQLEDEDDEIILDPQWLIQAFKLIVTTLVKFQQQGHESDALENYGKTGRLTLAFIETAWANDKTGRFLEFRDTILFYLDRLELIVMPLPSDGESSVDYYIVPCLLMEPNPCLIRPLLENSSVIRTPTLCFDFHGRFIPPAVHSKILASCIHRFEVMSVPGRLDEHCLQQGLGCFILSHYWKMVIHCKDSKVKVTLFSDIAKKVRKGDGYKIKNIVGGIINATLERNNQGHLTFANYISDDFEVKGKEDKTQSTPEARAVWFSERENEIVESEVSIDSTESKESDQEMLQRTPNSREVIRIAKHVGNNYIMFFIELGMSDVYVEQIRRDHEYKRDFLSQVARIIFAWKNQFEDKATFLEIRNAFDVCDLDFQSMLEDIRVMKSNDRMALPEDVGLPDRILNSRPVSDELESISILILKAYFVIFIELGVAQEHIELAEMDHHKALDMIVNLLQHWLQIYGDQATILKLYYAFKECRKPCTKFIDLVKSRLQRDHDEQNWQSPIQQSSCRTNARQYFKK